MSGHTAALAHRVEERRVRALDGTGIAYHVVGDGSPVLLANGLGGSWKAWTHQIRHFDDRHRFYCWDQRGLYRSEVPADRTALSIPAHAEDGLAVMQAEGLGKVSIWGWSMGVQVALEIWRRAPERISSLVLLNGVAGRPWDTLANLPALGRAAPYLLGGLRRIPRVVSAGTRLAVGWSGTPAVAKRLGLASETLDDDIFRQLAGSFGELDMEIYVRILEAIGEHDAHDVLPTIRVPMLVVTGGRDLMTPRTAAERLVGSVPGAELMIVPPATHYLAVEYPDLLNQRIERFLARAAGTRTGASAR